MPETDTLPVMPEVPAAATLVDAPVAPPSTSDAPPAAPAPAAEPAAATAEQAKPPPVPPVVPAPAISPEMQQYMDQMEERVQRAEATEDQQTLQSWASNLATRLENEQGFTPEQARFVADREAQQAYRAYSSERFRQGQTSAAFEIGQRFGVDPRRLMNLPTPAAMVQAATVATSQSKIETRLKALETENAELKKKLAPPQAFAAPGVSPTPAPGSYLEKLKSGGPLPSAAEIDKFTARYLTGSP